LELEFVQVQGVVAIPADEQGFSRPAGVRPAADKRIKICFRIDPQGEDPDDPALLGFVEEGDEDLQIDLPVLLIPVEILKNDFPLRRSRGKRRMCFVPVRRG
jgi:hypothetical protein